MNPGSRAPAARLRRRIAGLDWPRIERELGERGFARARLLGARDCRALARLYPRDERFRKTIDMARHRFGVGEYRYFDRPLPDLVRELRHRLYARLAPIASRWEGQLGSRTRYPARLDAFLARCRARGQTRPTPLLLRYERGGYNRLHQDLYGAVAFPLQVAVLLSRPGDDFRGGAFLLLEQWPRQQSRGEAIDLEQGEAVIFPNAVRPAPGARGVVRVQVRHGASTVHTGERFTLGVIFHDAK